MLTGQYYLIVFSCSRTLGKKTETDDPDNQQHENGSQPAVNKNEIRNSCTTEEKEITAISTETQQVPSDIKGVQVYVQSYMCITCVPVVFKARLFKAKLGKSRIGGNFGFNFLTFQWGFESGHIFHSPGSTLTDFKLLKT